MNELMKLKEFSSGGFIFPCEYFGNEKEGQKIMRNNALTMRI